MTKTVMLTERALEELIEQVGYEPSNVVIYNRLKDNEAIVFDAQELYQYKSVLTLPTMKDELLIKDGFYIPRIRPMEGK